MNGFYGVWEWMDGWPCRLLEPSRLTIRGIKKIKGYNMRWNTIHSSVPKKKLAPPLLLPSIFLLVSLRKRCVLTREQAVAS